jgi:uncharacterized protein YkwD
VPVSARVVRRAVIAAALVALAIGSAAYASGSAPPKRASAPTPSTTTTSAPTTTTSTTTTTVPPPPETEPAPEPEPPPPPPPPKPKPAPKPAQSGSGSEVAQLVSMVNNYRAANGLPALATASDATAKAQQHSNDMAAQGRIYHSSSMSSGIKSGWSALGENVGMGGSVSQVESMFEGSGPHRANLLNGDFTQIGVGVAHGSDGQLYVTEFFVGR